MSREIEINCNQTVLLVFRLVREVEVSIRLARGSIFISPLLEKKRKKERKEEEEKTETIYKTHTCFKDETFIKG